MATVEDVSQLSFEAALARLDEIVRTLEKGEAPVDRFVELHTECDWRATRCEAARGGRRRQEAAPFAHRRSSAAVRDRFAPGATRRLRHRGDPRLFADP